METFKNHTKYQQLAEILKARLDSYAQGSRLPSVRATMKRFNVSQHTVMSALQLLEDQELIERRHGSGLYRSSTNHLPVIAYCRPKSPSTELEFRENALQSACDTRGWKLHIHRFDPHHVDLFADEIKADGFVLQPEMVTFHSPILSQLVQNGIPRVVMGRDTGSANLDFAVGDDASILKELLKHLVNQGHRSVAFLVSEPAFYEVLERVKLFNQISRVLKLKSPIVLDAKVEYGRDSFAQTSEYLQSYLGSLPGQSLPFTALITCSHPGSITALRTLGDAGFRVPDDCSLCCMGCDHMAQYAVPSITNASSVHAELAEACLRILDQRFQGNKAPLLYESIVCRANWRESTGRVSV